MLCSPEPIKVQLKEQFLKMKNLRLLIIRNLHSSGHLEYLPNELRFLDWPGYPFSSLPTNFCPKKLVALNMSGSRLEKKFKQVFLLIIFINYYFLKLYSNFFFFYRYFRPKPWNMWISVGVNTLGNYLTYQRPQT